MSADSFFNEVHRYYGLHYYDCTVLSKNIFYEKSLRRP